MRTYNMKRVVANKGTDLINMQIRRFTIPLTEVIARNTSITPNQISILGIFFAVASLILVAQEHYYVGALAVFIVAILDHLDGKLARVLETRSLKGEWLDGMMNLIYQPMLMVAIGIGTGYYYYAMLATLALGLEYIIAYKWRSDFASKLPTKSIHMGVRKTSRLRFVYGGHLVYHLFYPAALFGLFDLYLVFFGTVGNTFNITMLLMQWRQLK